MIPNHNKNVFKQIFNEYWSEFQSMNSEYQTEYYDSVIKKMLGCGDSENGFMVYRCLFCGEVKRIPFSCKSSFCLSCAKIYRDEWVEYISKALFSGMRYRHVVLTVPEQLRKWFYHNAELLSKFMKTGHNFFEDVVSYWIKKPVEVGSVVVLQTAGRKGGYNPHLHILCTSGGITKEGKWKEFGFIEYKLLHTKWQYHLLKMLRENAEGIVDVKCEEIEKGIDKCWKEYSEGLVAYIEKGDVPSGGKGIAYYLAKYVVSPPISLRRIIKYDGKRVRYWYNDHITEKRKEEEIEAQEFIGRMVQHILPKGFQRIRYYGLQATCKASKIREEIKEIIKEKEGIITGTYFVTGYRERIKKDFGIDPLRCSKCRKEMEFEGIWHPRYGWIINNWDNFFSEEEKEYAYG
ncbi:transposase [Candidatus Pacearchaeota archaeon]|nr:transposase [Candidatus Pacearchaeota archaeon]